LRKWTVQRWQAQPRTLAIAAVSPACASLMASWTPISGEPAEDAGPERFGLGLADVEGEDLAPAGLMPAMGDHQRRVDHPAAAADLLDLGVLEPVRVAASDGRVQKASTCSSNAWQTRLTPARADPQAEALDS
jgi:hypothetical protein